MQDEVMQVSKTTAATLGAWAIAAVLAVAVVFVPGTRAMLLCQTVAIMCSGFAAAWTVRCFMRAWMGLVTKAYQLGYDNGRREREVPLQRVPQHR